jgi:hypothetical protein
VSEGAAAAMLREDLVNWEFNPFAADACVKCGMVEAMFHRLGLSQVTRRILLVLLKCYIMHCCCASVHTCFCVTL